VRKRIINRESQGAAQEAADWLNLESLAQVEVTSEEEGHPVEGALLAGGGPAWAAAEPGAQVIRLFLDAPQRLGRIRLVFVEEDRARTQEFVLRWSADGGRTYREVVRQQFTFSPPVTAREVEDYRVDLSGATALELEIVPDIGGGEARASLAQLRLAP
jgi:hypothetical protein